MLRFRTNQEREECSLHPREDAPAIVEPRIESYLDSVSQAHDSADQTSLREEARGHLLDLVEAYEELGYSRAEAIEHAIAQFGDARHIRRNWSRMLAGSSRQSFVVSLRVYSASLLFVWLAVAAGRARFDFLALLLSPWMLVAWFPILPGLIAGALSRSRPARASLAAQSLLLLPWIALSFWIFVWPKAAEILLDRGMPPTFLNGVAEILNPNSIVPWGLTTGILAATGLLWVAAGTLSASIGGWVARHIRTARAGRQRANAA